MYCFISGKNNHKVYFLLKYISWTALCCFYLSKEVQLVYKWMIITIIWCQCKMENSTLKTEDSLRCLSCLDTLWEDSTSVYTFTLVAKNDCLPESDFAVEQSHWNVYSCFSLDQTVMMCWHQDNSFPCVYLFAVSDTFALPCLWKLDRNEWDSRLGFE